MCHHHASLVPKADLAEIRAKHAADAAKRRRRAAAKERLELEKKIEAELGGNLEMLHTKVPVGTGQSAPGSWHR